MSDSRIIRAERTIDHRYQMISRAMAEDEKLSFEARGALLYILVKPEDWKINVKDLQRRGRIGRDKAYRIISEWIDCGYCERITHRDKGMVVGTDYVIHESPLPEKPDTDKPDTDKPDTDKPDTENQYYTNYSKDTNYSQVTNYSELERERDKGTCNKEESLSGGHIIDTLADDIKDEYKAFHLSLTEFMELVSTLLTPVGKGDFIRKPSGGQDVNNAARQLIKLFYIDEKYKNQDELVRHIAKWKEQATENDWKSYIFRVVDYAGMLNSKSSTTSLIQQQLAESAEKLGLYKD